METGDTYTSEPILVTAEMVAAFAAISGDDNPAHRCPGFPPLQKLGIEGPIAHGMLLGALVSGVLGSDKPGWGTIYVGQNWQWIRPVPIGATVIVRLECLSRSGRKAEVSTTVEMDGLPVATGVADLRLPTDEEQEGYRAWVRRWDMQTWRVPVGAEAGE